MRVHNVLLKALITEKTMKESESGKYTFLVAQYADKKAIKRAVEMLFHVDVMQVLTRVTKGRTKRTGPKRIQVSQSPIKKAMVRLKAGQSLSGTQTEAPQPEKGKKKEKKA